MHICRSDANTKQNATNVSVDWVMDHDEKWDLFSVYCGWVLIMSCVSSILDRVKKKNFFKYI